MVPALLRPVSLAALLVLLVACEAARPPLTRSQAISAADSLLLREYLVWGNAIEVLDADTVEVDGQWWQVRYPDGPHGKARIILVDERTRWARFVPDGYVARAPAVGARRTVDAVRLDQGPWILAVLGTQTVPKDQRVQAEIDVKELNALARRTGLQAAFSLRPGNDESVTIIWGWQGDHGTLRDERVREWLAVRTRFQDSRWVDLTE